MLTLREPIQLKTGLSLAGGCEAFGQRLNGNYSLMTARIAPKDLLFLVTTPPEFPEDLGGVSSLELRNAFTDIQQTKVDVVNNVLNRIILNQDSHFTYQDQVYITSVLRKLGVQDVTRFMEEVRRLREEQSNLVTLTRLYRQETTQRALALLHEQSQTTQRDQTYVETVLRELGMQETSHTAEEVRRLWEEREHLTARTSLTHRETVEEKTALPGQEEAQPGQSSGSAPRREETRQAPAPRYYLHQEIYHRLGTGDIYQQVAAFHHNVTGLGDSFTNQELRLSEQLRVSQALQLQELRQHNVYGGAVALHHHVNRYEQGDLLEPPETREQVLSQAAEAALLSTVDHVLTHTLERYGSGRDMWLTLSHSLTQVAENSLSRFETYHTQNTNRFREGERYQSWYRTMEEREIQSLQQLRESWHTRETLERLGTPAAELPMPSQFQTPVELDYLLPGQTPEGEEGAQPPTEGRTGLTTLELTNLTQQILGRALQPEGQPARPGVQPGTPQEGQAGRQPEPQAEELIYRQGQPPVSAEETGAQGAPSERTTQLLRQTLRETISREGQPAKPEARQAALRETVERLREQRRQELYHTSRQAALTLRELVDMERDTVVMEQQSRSLPSQAAPEQLVREMREIDRLSQERLERLNTVQLSERPRAEAVPAAQQARTRADALRALEQPELVLRQLREDRQEETEGTPPAGAAPAQTVLERADPVSQKLYETVLRYQQLRESWYTRDTIEQTFLPGAAEAEAPPRLQPPVELTYGIPGQTEAEPLETGRTPEGQSAPAAPESAALTRRSLEEALGPAGQPGGAVSRPEGPAAPGLKPGQAEPGEELIYRQDQPPVPSEEEAAGVVPPEHTTELIRQTLRETISQEEPSRPAAQPGVRQEMETVRQELHSEDTYHTYRQDSLVLRETWERERDTVVEEGKPLSQPARETGPQPPRADQVRETLEILRQEGERQLVQHSYTGTEAESREGTPAERVYHETPAAPEAETAAPGGAIPEAQATPEQLMRELREIDRLNRERVERLRDAEQPQVRQVRPTAADQARTRADALRALEQPELVLRQLEEARQEEEPQGGVPPQVEQILRQADPVTRKLYETVLKYQQNPRAATAEGLIHASNVGAFNADTAQRQAAAEQREEGAAIRYPSSTPAAEPQLPPAGEQALERLREGARRRGAQPHRPGSWEKLPFVFKREDNSAYEELIQRLEEQRTQQTIQQPVHEEVTRQSTSETQINDFNRQVVNHTTEDITALINRTMAQQMNQITSQVYRQMERRLQTERNRRGRF